MSARAYDEFLTSKIRATPGVGIDVADTLLHPRLFPFQREIVLRMLTLGRGAIFASTGLGKTSMQIEWARIVAETTALPVLIFAPLAVASQTVREARVIGVDVTSCKEQSDVTAGVNITNYDRLDRFDCSILGGIVLDECFAPDTLIDTPAGRIPICQLKVGDTITNATGSDVIGDVHRREVAYCVKITVDGDQIVSSSNHPYFTQRGWVGAQDIEPGDKVIRTAEALRILRDRVYSEVNRRTFLREILLSEVEDASTRVCCESSQPGSGGETRAEQKRVARERVSCGTGGDRSYPRAEPDAHARSLREDFAQIERDGPRTFRAWGKWSRDDEAAAIAAGHSWRRMAGGTCRVVGNTESRLSNTLQDRLSERRDTSRYRSGWALTSEPQGPGQQKGLDAGFARVESLEILEPGHPELDRLRDADGRIYLYDLGATRHPSYSVNGFLVHNSSILKATDGKTRTALIGVAQSIPFRLACTATPAPNDVMELGNHADFLGVMESAEMLATYFVHDGGETQKWRLKGHAEGAFWRWVSSWAMVVDSPSDLGYDGSAYVLPDLRMHEHVLDAPAVTDGDTLFALPASSLTERRGARSASVGIRVAKAAEIIESSPGPWIIWCHLNSEQDLLAKAFGESAFSIFGSMPSEEKERQLLCWLDGERPILISKPSILGFGINAQICSSMAFVGIDDSWESLYQSIRRCWRFGQSKPVDVHLILSSAEIRVLENLKRKERDAARMRHAMAAATESARVPARSSRSFYTRPSVEVPSWLNPS